MTAESSSAPVTPIRERPQRRRGRVPVVQQLTNTECGAACLAMVLAYHGRHIPLRELREASGVGRDGIDARTILETAEQQGLNVRALTLGVSSVAKLPPASILHWGFNHFVVLERVGRDAIHIVDPAFGRRRVAMDEFRRDFTGVALTFEPGERFEPIARRHGRIWHYGRQIGAHFGGLARVLFTSALLQGFALATPLLTGLVVDRVIPQRDANLLVQLGGVLLLVLLLSFLTSMVRAHVLIAIRAKFDTRMTLDLLEHLVSLPYAFFETRSTGDLLARINSNTTVREIFTSGVLSGLLDAVLAVSFLAVMLTISVPMGALVVVLGGLQMLVIVLGYRRQRELMAFSLEAQARADGRLVELISGIETLKAIGGEQRSVQGWSDLFVDVLNASIERDRLDALLQSIVSTIRLASPLVALSYGALLVLDGTMSLGTMLALNALAVAFFIPLSGLTSTVGQVQFLSSYLARLDDVFETKPHQDPSAVETPPPLTGAIEVEGLTFAYSRHSPAVVDDVSFVARRGELIAIVGRSGSGKSTLASVLVGLRDANAGKVAFDGLALPSLDLVALRKQVRLVPQTPHLFSGSIKANVSMAEPDLDEAQIVEAAKRACIHDEIAEMPMGYETVLADGGTSLSGGQRQRLALARALVSPPAVVVLDEATSALDAVTEAAVFDRLSELDCTRIVIAHRLSTIVGADQILVMDRGRIVERGTHASLLATDGVYASLVRAQLRSAKEDEP